MASHALELPVFGRVDTDGRLVAADAPLLMLQEQAGGRLGSQLAVPQLAAIARLAIKLAVPITRSALAANDAEDLDLWVRAEPDAEGVTLLVERWTSRPPAEGRWSGQASASVDEVAASETVQTDAELKIVNLTPALARRLAVDPAKVFGTPLARLLRPVEDDDGNIPMLAALAARGAYTGQLVEVRGSAAKLLLDGNPRNEDGRFAGYTIGVRESDRPAVGGLVSLPLDDLLKEPLASIIEEAQQIASRNEGPLRSDYAGYGADIAAAARHLLDVLASISADPPAPGAALGGENEEVDLAELVLDAAGLVQPQASAKGVVLDVGGAQRLPAQGQPRAVTQILVNLITNAVRYSPQGASVTITLENGNAAAVTVSDIGPGVAVHDRERIFQRFEQGASKSGTAGLGLTISRRLAREMGGDVELLDSPVGASFRLRLPPA